MIARFGSHGCACVCDSQNCLLEQLGIYENTHRHAPRGCDVKTAIASGEKHLEKGDGV